VHLEHNVSAAGGMYGLFGVPVSSVRAGQLGGRGGPTATASLLSSGLVRRCAAWGPDAGWWVIAWEVADPCGKPTLVEECA
jgi:hypothetical protein